MNPKKTKATKTSGKNKYLLQLTRKGVFLGICLIFFISAWMFVLGILVGRGTAPVHFDIEVLQKELIALKESIIKQAQEKERAETPAIEKSQKLDFYEALKDSKKAEKVEFKNGEARPPAPSPGKIEDKTGTPPKKQLFSMKKKTKSKATPSQKGAYAVQVASTKEATEAEALVKKLNSNGYRAYTIKAEIPGKGTWYRVRVGGFTSSAEADKATDKLATLGYKGMVVKN
jgi:cell division septation protein DedD